MACVVAYWEPLLGALIGSRESLAHLASATALSWLIVFLAGAIRGVAVNRSECGGILDCSWGFPAATCRRSNSGT